MMLIGRQKHLIPFELLNVVVRRTGLDKLPQAVSVYIYQLIEKLLIVSSSYIFFLL